MRMRMRGSLAPRNAGVGRRWMGWRRGRTMGTTAGEERDKPWIERAGRERQNYQEMAQGVFMPW